MKKVNFPEKEKGSLAGAKEKNHFFLKQWKEHFSKNAADGFSGSISPPGQLLDKSCCADSNVLDESDTFRVDFPPCCKMMIEF